MFSYDDKISLNEKFFLELPENNLVDFYRIIVKYRDYILLKNKRRLFVCRQKFAQKISNYFFKKEYKTLNQSEKFYLTYYFFYLDYPYAMQKFSEESNFNICKKMSFIQMKNQEKELLEIHKKSLKKFQEIKKMIIKKLNHDKNKRKKSQYPNEDPMTPIEVPISSCDYILYKNIPIKDNFKDPMKQLESIIVDLKDQHKEIIKKETHRKKENKDKFEELKNTWFEITRIYEELENVHYNQRNDYIYIISDHPEIEIIF